MDDAVAETEEGSSPQMPYVGMASNLGEPIRFTDVEDIGGISLAFAQEGEMVELCTQIALTSDEPLFHRFADGMANFIHHLARQAGVAVSLRRVDTTLLVLREDHTAELWLDTAAEAVNAIAKRTLKAGVAVFDHDLADVLSMSFPCVRIGPTDKVFCIFRAGWRFGMAFDFHPTGHLNVEEFQRALGWLLRNLQYRHLYESLGNETVFTRLIAAGWFPFVEIISSEIKELLPFIEAGRGIDKQEERILANFTPERLKGLLDRWTAKPHLAKRRGLLETGVAAFNRKEPITVIKVLLTEIEGVLNDAYRAANDGKGAKIKELLKFATDSAEKKVGRSDTLMFPKAFGTYLSEQTFANFDPAAGTGTAGSRHAVGHGAAPQETYTMVRALQVILTLDQLAFYT